MSKDHNRSNARTETPPNMMFDLTGSSTSSPKPGSPRNHVATSAGDESTDTMVTTAVSNGNDAQGLLFEAAQREERDSNDTRGVAATEHTLSYTTASPYSNTLNTNPLLLPKLSDELLDTWNAYRFVRMGWLSAEECVWLLDLWVLSWYFTIM
jgi:hypothetical protein